MKTKIRVITAALLALALAAVIVGTTACGEPEADAIILKNAPTVTSKYDEKLAIADDGLLRVRDLSGNVSDVKITLDMIDQTGFDNKSLEEQTLLIRYGGKEVSFSFKLIREASQITIKTMPTVPEYTEQEFEIGGNGVLSVTYKDGGTDEIPITEDMIDASGYDPTSTEKQTIYVNYGGVQTSFDITLTYDPIDDSGEEKQFRFETEFADIGGGTVDIELCGGDEYGGYVKRPDGTNDECVKNLFLGEGGYITFTIESSKRCHATLSFAIGTNGFDPYPDLDMYSRIIVNGESLESGIDYDASNPIIEGGVSPWWTFQLYEMTTDIVLKRGENTITIATYEYAGVVTEAGDTSSAAGGRNFSYMLVDTTAALTEIAPE